MRNAILVMMLVLAACDGSSNAPYTPGLDGGDMDGGIVMMDAAQQIDAATDAAVKDAAVSHDAAVVDASIDAAVDAAVPDAAVGSDAGVDASTDASVAMDATVDAAVDASVPDAAVDAGTDAGASPTGYRIEIWGYDIPTRRRRLVSDNTVPGGWTATPNWQNHDLNAPTGTYAAPDVAFVTGPYSAAYKTAPHDVDLYANTASGAPFITLSATTSPSSITTQWYVIDNDTYYAGEDTSGQGVEYFPTGFTQCTWDTPPRDGTLSTVTCPHQVVNGWDMLSGDITLQVRIWPVY